MDYFIIMKKLFTLLILSFFATSGFSGVSYAPAENSQDEPDAVIPTKGCADGGEPIKSVSDDGFYFVYTCGGAPEVPVVSPKTESSSETASDKLSSGDLEEDDYISKIKEVKALLDSGIISQQQFEEMTQKIIDNI